MTTNLINTYFLEVYKPEDCHRTSMEEMEKINKNLLIDDFDLTLKDHRENNNFSLLHEVRNQVVEFYLEKMTKESKTREDEMNIITSMQSVTAVIDNYIYSPEI
ncbi:MAG: hypothetical protein J1F35_08285 [Erysipelotrichales bacterium]|nr:hypothetical protein [Erysipelotrichales bacterium]